MTTPLTDATRPCVGLVGLGLVGTALAKRLKHAGYACIGFDVRSEAMRVFEMAGFATAPSVVDIAQKSNTLILAVFDTSGVIEVAKQIELNRHAQQKVLQSDHLPVLTLIDCSTGDPMKLAELAQQLAASHVHLIEAPLSGSSVQIENGEATLLLGGESQHIQHAQAVLNALATSQVHVGTAGMAAKAKLATNLVLGLNRAALAEGIVFAQTMGIAPAAFLQLVLKTPARSEAAVVKGEMMVKEQFEPQSRIRQHLKDVQLMLDIAQTAEQNLPLSQVHASLMRNAIAEGDGDLDNAAIVRQIRREKTSRSPKQ